MNSSIKRFEALTGEEVYHILKSRTEVFILGQGISEPDCDEWDTFSYHLFMQEGKEVIAYLRIIDKGAAYDEAAIGRVLVLKEYRNSGLARSLMHQAMNFIKETLKEEKVKISAQSYIVPFYKSLGFEVVSDEYEEAGIPHVKMICTLK